MASRYNPNQYHDLRRKPIKTAYFVYELITTYLLRVPYWAITNIFKSWRPKPSWSILRCIKVRVLSHFFVKVSSRTGPLVKLPDHKHVQKGGVWISPVPSLIIGELRKWADEAKVVSIRIPGYWATRNDAGTPVHSHEKVILYFHGGAFITLSAHESSILFPNVTGLLKHLPSVQRVFSVEYRLSTTEPYETSSPFPAALIDAIAGYDYLISLGFAAEDILVAGDSAGGNLAHALTRYLVENSTSEGIPASPGRLLLISPWVDLSDSHEGPNSSLERNVSSDYIGPNGGGITNLYARSAYLGPVQLAKQGEKLNPYISPASLHPTLETSISFKGFPKTMIIAGGGEVILDSIKTLANRMGRDLGKDLTYYEAEDAVHDFSALPWFEPQRTDALKAISEWYGGY